MCDRTRRRLVGWSNSQALGSGTSNTAGSLVADVAPAPSGFAGVLLVSDSAGPEFVSGFRETETSRNEKGAPSGAPLFSFTRARPPASTSANLRRLDQLHLAFFVAEDEDLAVAELGLLDGLFQAHGAERDGVLRRHDVRFGGAHQGGIGMHDHRHGGGGAGANGHLQGAFARLRGGPFAPLMPLARAPARLVLDRLPLDAAQRLADHHGHLGAFGRAHNRVVAHQHGDL